MEGINKKYNLEIEVLTPLSIGAGAEKDWVRGVDFVVDNGKLYKLNLKKIVANGIKVDDLTDCFATKNEKGLKAKLTGKLDDVSDFSMPFPAESDNDVKAFVKNQLGGNPVLTGSSLKGALRSVLFQYLDGKSKDGKEVFGSSTNGDEFMRFIKISDAEFDQTELVNTKIFNLRGNGNNWQGGWKFSGSRTDANFQSTGFNTLYESLMPKQKGYASLMMSEKSFRNFDIEKFYEKKKNELQSQFERERLPEKQQKIQKNIKDVERLLKTVEYKKTAIQLDNLFCIINQHTKDYLLKEKAFFEKYHAERSDEIVDSIDALLNQIPSDGSFCILKMSAGSGFHSITGDWQFPDGYFNGRLDRKRASKDDLKEAGKVLPKSRKIADWNNNLSLMGFVKLCKLNKDEVDKIEAERQETIHKKEAKRIAEIAEEQKRKEGEEQAIREQKEKEERYARLLTEGKKYSEEKLYDKALACYAEAKELLPQKENLDTIIADLNRQIQAENLSKSIEANKQRELEQRKQENAVPLFDKIAKVQKLPTLYGNVKQWMKQNEIESLSDNDKNVLFGKTKEIVFAMKERERKKLKDLGKDLDLLVGPDTATRWYQDLNSK